MLLSTTPSESLQSKLTQEYYKNKQEQTACDYGWQIDNVKARLDYLEFITSKLTKIIEDNPELIKGV